MPFGKSDLCALDMTSFTNFISYYWFPGTIMPILTFSNWITWIKPQSAVVAIMTGGYYFNLGFNPLSTFDYNRFATRDPSVTPWFVLCQIVAAVALWGLCVMVPVFFTNTWHTGYCRSTRGSTLISILRSRPPTLVLMLLLLSTPICLIYVH